MSYIEQTLTDGEIIREFLKYHWFYIVFPVMMMFLGFTGVLVGVFLLFSTRGDGDISEFIVLLLSLSILVMVLSFLNLVYRWIATYTTEQALTNKRVFRKTGLVRRDTDELILEKVETVAISQSILGRIFDYGDIEFTGMGGIYIRLIYIPNPTLVKKNFNY